MKLPILYFFHSVGLLVIFFASLFGLAFITKGSLILSTLGAIVIILLLGAVVYLMIKEKGHKENKGITLIEWVSYVLYTVIAVISFFIVAHFINVNFILKSDIIKASKNKLEANQAIFGGYKKKVEETTNIIDTQLRNAVIKGGSERKETFSKNGVDPLKIDNYNTERKKILEANKKRAMQGFVSQEQNFLNFRQKKGGVLENWNPFKFHRTILEIDDEYDKTIAVLQSNFKAPEKNKAWNKFSFDYPSSPRQISLIENPLVLMEKYQPSFIIPLIVTLLAHFFILMLYLFTKRNGTRRIYRPNLKRKVIGID
jgi:hypothetical protein